MDDLAGRLRELVANSDFYSWVGMSVAEARPGDVTVALEARPEHLNLQGFVHGGLLATLADSAMGIAVRSEVEPGHRHVTTQLGIQYLRPGRPGRILARGRTLRIGLQVGYAEAEVTDDRGRVLARAQGTYSVTAPPEP